MLGTEHCELLKQLKNALKLNFGKFLKELEMEF